MTPTVDAFQALARSSPWRWSTLHFRHLAQGEPAVEAWVERPGRLVVRTEGRDHEVTEPPWPLPEPTFRDDGLVANRPRAKADTYDDPMWENYRWVAMLDPAELSHHVEVDRLREDELHGRPVWRAELRPVLGYSPRCGDCCDLLMSDAGRLSDHLDDVSQARAKPADLVYPDAYDVALDVETGIVAHLATIGGNLDPFRLDFDNEILEVGAPQL